MCVCAYRQIMSTYILVTMMKPHFKGKTTNIKPMYSRTYDAGFACTMQIRGSLGRGQGLGLGKIHPRVYMYDNTPQLHRKAQCLWQGKHSKCLVCGIIVQLQLLHVQPHLYSIALFSAVQCLGGGEKQLLYTKYMIMYNHVCERLCRPSLIQYLI